MIFSLVSTALQHILSQVAVSVPSDIQVASLLYVYLVNKCPKALQTIIESAFVSCSQKAIFVNIATQCPVSGVFSVASESFIYSATTVSISLCPQPFTQIRVAVHLLLSQMYSGTP